MAANGEGSEKGPEHPSAMSLFAPATQAAVSFHVHVTCLFWVFEPGCFLRRTWYCFYVELLYYVAREVLPIWPLTDVSSTGSTGNMTI